MTVTTRTHYDVLGIARDADDTEIRRAWKLLVQVWHPDRFEGATRDDAERMTASINEAYHTLRDQRARERYDLKIDAATAPPPTPSRARTHAPAPRYASPAGGAIAIHQPTLGDSVAALANDVVDAAKRRPKVVAAVVAAWLLLVAGPTIWSTVSAPDMPDSRTTSTAMMVQEQEAANRLSEQIAKEHAAAASVPDELGSTYEPSPPIEEAPAYEPAPEAAVPAREPRHIIVRPNNR